MLPSLIVFSNHQIDEEINKNQRSIRWTMIETLIYLAETITVPPLPPNGMRLRLSPVSFSAQLWRTSCSLRRWPLQPACRNGVSRNTFGCRNGCRAPSKSQQESKMIAAAVAAVGDVSGRFMWPVCHCELPRAQRRCSTS